MMNVNQPSVRSHVLRHEKSLHKNELFKCKDCDYSNTRKDNLHRHTRSKHAEKNIKINNKYMFKLNMS